MSMLLQELFSQERIYTDIKAEDKLGALTELVDFLTKIYKLENNSEILDKILKREEKMSTGLKDGFAFPHAKLDLINRCYGVLGISYKGVDFKALNGEPVYIIFLLVDSVQDVEEHLFILKRMAQLVKTPDFYKEMISTHSADEAHRVVKKFEDLV